MPSMTVRSMRYSVMGINNDKDTKFIYCTGGRLDLFVVSIVLSVF